MTFRLAPEYQIQEVDLPRGHKEYRITCTLKSIQSGAFVGQGVGCCSSMESKYRWRQGTRKCPKCGKESIIKGKADYGGGWLCWDKRGGCGMKWPDGAAEIESQSTDKVENENPADCFNTVLKIAKKRAFVDATITATAASDIFTQDIGDDEEVPAEAPISRPVPKPPSEPHQPVKVAQKPIGGTQTGQNTAMVGALKQRIEKLKASLGPKLEYATAYLRVFTVSGSDQGTSLMPNEDVSDLSETSVDWLAHNWGDFIKRLDAYIEDQGGLGPVAGTPAAPAEDPDWFWDVIIVVPRRGMKKAEYQKNPDTIRSLYHAMKAGDEDAQARLWGLAEQWTPEPWTSPKGQVYQPSEADLKCRKALDAYLEHEKKGNQ